MKHTVYVTYVKGCEQYSLNMVTIMSNTVFACRNMDKVKSQFHDQIVFLCRPLGCTLVRSVAVHSMNTFFVFREIFE